MPQLTNANRSQLLAAATAITAAGFLTVSPPVQAHPMLPLAPACNQYVFNGDFTLRQDNGALISFNSTGPVAGGTARGGTDSGTVTGSIQGRNVDFTINWGGPDIQPEYIGTVGDDALIHNGGQRGTPFTWDSTRPLGCQNSLLSEPATLVPNQRVVPPAAPMTTSTSSPADVTELPNQRVIPPFAPMTTSTSSPADVTELPNQRVIPPFAPATATPYQ
jgi:hypothetical protein